MTQSTMRTRASVSAAPPKVSHPNPQQAQSAYSSATVPSPVAANVAPDTPGNRGAYAALKRSASGHISRHGHALPYGIIGLVVAALILIIGFWPTLLLAAFAAVGGAIGAYRDGDLTIRAQLKRLIDLFS